MFGKMFQWANLTRVLGILGIANGGTGAATAAGARTNLDVYSKSETDSLVSGLLDLRGSFDASGGGYPTTGGSGTAGAILKGDAYKISVSGAIGQLNDVVYALVDSPAQTASNWEVIEGNLSESSFGFFSNSLTAKTTPVDADSVNFVDSADSNKSKKITWTNIKATLKTYFDTLYGNLNTVNVWTKSQSITPVSLTSSSGNVAVDASLSNIFKHTLTENTTVAAPSNLAEGASYAFLFTQHASSAKTLAFNAAFLFADGIDPVISATFGRTLKVKCDYIDGKLSCDYNQNYL